jgi:hypothetical protein
MYTGSWSNEFLIFSSNKARKNLQKIDLVTRSCFDLCLLKTIPVIVKAFFTKKNLLYFTQNIFGMTNIQPDIRHPALTGYPAEYPVSGFWISRISGKNSIRCIPTLNNSIIRLDILGLPVCHQ